MKSVLHLSTTVANSHRNISNILAGSKLVKLYPRGCLLRLLVTMIEFCTKKRMAAAIVTLIGVSVVVLIVENNLSWGEHDIKDVTGSPENSSNECGPNVTGESKEDCRPCTKYEKKALDFCSITGYIELIKCPDKTKLRSCPKVSWMEEKNFWIFESCVAVIGIASYTMVNIRQKRLDKLLLDKVHKQIAAGV